jgi:hypothetical protein
MRRRLTSLAGLAVALSAALAVATAAHAAAPPSPSTPDLVDDSGLSLSDEITNAATPTFTVVAGVAQAGMTVTIYAVPVDGGSSVPVGTGTVDGAANASVTTSSIGDEVYDISATTKNGLGEESTHSLALEVMIDTKAPTIVDDLLLIESAGAGLTFTQTPTFGVLVGGTDVPVTLKTYEGTTLLGTAQTGDLLNLGGGSSQSYGTVPTATPLSDGQHTVFATAEDVAGNESAPSPSLTIEIDGTPPVIGSPDLLAAGDDGASSTDNKTKNPRPRFVFATEPSVRVIIYSDGIAIGGGQADAIGAATIRVNDLNCFDPGEHCVYAKAIDSVGHASVETSELCITVEDGGVPFTSNLGADLEGDFIALSLRSTLAGKVTLRVLANGKPVKFRIGKKKAFKKKVTRKLKATKRKRLRLRISKRVARKAKIRVVASVKSNDGRRLLLKKRALARRAL